MKDKTRSISLRRHQIHRWQHSTATPTEYEDVEEREKSKQNCKKKAPPTRARTKREEELKPSPKVGNTQDGKKKSKDFNLGKGFSKEELVSMHAADLDCRGLDLCQKLNDLRESCKNLSGTYRGRFRDTTKYMNDLVHAYVEKMEIVGDVSYLKQKVFELSEELQASKRREETSRKDNDELRNMVNDLRKELRVFKDQCGLANEVADY